MAKKKKNIYQYDYMGLFLDGEIWVIFYKFSTIGMCYFSNKGENHLKNYYRSTYGLGVVICSAQCIPHSGQNPLTSSMVGG